MLRHERSAPIWLFSFVDLAFLLLIAFTQIGPDFDASSLPVGQLEIPQIQSAAAPLSGNPEAASWQLIVHPVAAVAPDQTLAGSSRAVFELIEPGAANAPPNTEGVTRRIDGDLLASHLRLLESRRTAKPILAPHRDSRSEDLLVAVGLLEEVWGAGRSVAVRPGPAVAAGPAAEDALRR